MGRDGGKERPIGSWRREARLNLKRYLLILVKQAVPLGTRRDGGGFCSTLCFRKSGRKITYQMETFWTLSFHRNQMWKQLSLAEVKRQVEQQSLKEYFVTQLYKVLGGLLFFVGVGGGVPSHKFQDSLAICRGLSPVSNQLQASGLEHYLCGSWALWPSQTPSLIKKIFLILFYDCIGIKINIG